jgi:chemotaxis protein methyltransferase CheR
MNYNEPPLREQPTEYASIEPLETIVVQMTEAEFEKLRVLVYNRMGIHLSPEKRTMMNVRLQKVLKRMNFQSFSEYYDFLVTSPNLDVAIEFADCVTTNHTFFYREKDHFDYFVQTVLPEMTTFLAQRKDMDFRVWCAGCSSGEEAYMLAILLMEFFGAEYRVWKAGVLATDISERALSAAITAVYPSERMGLLPAEYKQKYFQAIVPGSFDDVPDNIFSKALSGEFWRVREKVRREVVFRKLNLMNATLPFKKPFHVIFCRNVMIYFDKPTRDALIERLYEALVPGGYLFVGHSETISRDTSYFRYVIPAVYQKPVS